MKSFLRATAGAALLSVLVASTAGAQDLSSFAVLAGSTVSNTGPSVIGGNIGVTPGLAIVGFPPGTVTPPYSKHAGDGVAINAMAQLISAYNALAGQPATADLSGQDLAGKTLGSGVYSFSSDAQLNGQLTLDGHGKTNGIFIFNIGSTLTAGAGSQVLLINGANANNVFFRVGSSATLLASAQFKGKILALQDITLVTAATINCGAALTQVGAVTLDTNTIGVCPVTAGTAGTGTSGSVSGTALGDAIQAYLDAGGVLPLGLGVLGLLTPDELAAALAELAGETATGGQYTTGEAMDSFLEQLSGHHAPGDVPPAEEAPGQGTVSVMGYADASPVPGAGAFQDFDAGRAATVPHWHLWSAGYGNYSIANGDADAGTAERTSAAYGLTFGLERVVTSDVLFGFAISGGGTNFNLDNSLGSGHSAMMQAAAYGRIDSDRAYVSAATAYALHDMHTNRTVTLLGTDEFAAQFWTQDVAGQIEAGYHLGWLTPYAGARVQYIATPGYSETTTSGTSTYALDYAAHAVLTARTEIGARAEWTNEFDSATLRLHAKAAWAHTFATDRSITANLQSLPGATFQIQGANPAADAFLIGLGTDLELQTGLVIGVSLDSSLSGSAQSYSGNAHLGYRW